MINLRRRVTLRPDLINNYIAFRRYIEDTGRWSDDYDYRAFYNDPHAYGAWVKEEMVGPGQAHFLGRYKKLWHITYEGENGENWVEGDGTWHYYVP